MNAKSVTKTTGPDITKSLIEDYQNRELFGKITIYMEAGEVTNIRVEESFQPRNLTDKYGKKPKFVIRKKEPQEIQETHVNMTNESDKTTLQKGESFQFEELQSVNDGNGNTKE